MIKIFSKFLPGFVRKKYADLLKYCDIDISAEKFSGTISAMALAVGAIVVLNLYFIFSLSEMLALAAFVSIYMMFHVVTYAWLALRADGKGKFVENVLPDMLLLMAMNIKSGMTTDRAFIMTARPEFGPLEKELNHAGRQILAGKPIKYALLEIAYRIRSKILERTINLIVEGIESGGELSNLLQQTAEEIQDTKMVQSEVRANILMYAIFIIFAAGVGAPLLFGVSTYLVGSIGQQTATLQSMDPSKTNMFLITQNFLVLFAVLSLAVTSFFASLIVGIVKTGEEKAGLKYIPMMMLMSVTIFFAVRFFVGNMLPSV